MVAVDRETGNTWWESQEKGRLDRLIYLNLDELGRCKKRQGNQGHGKGIFEAGETPEPWSARRWGRGTRDGGKCGETSSFAASQWNAEKGEMEKEDLEG